ncbi:MAG TPA: hypothetical protein VF590_06985 [Isosphaeraceae bacterium]
MFLLSWKPLLGLLYLVPLVGAFLWGDARLVARWQRRIAELWVRRELELDNFAVALRSNPILPPGMLSGMLATLPSQEAGPRTGQMTPAIREAVAARAQTILHCQSDRTALGTLGSLLGFTSLVAAAALQSWALLGGLLLTPLVLATGLWSPTLRFRRWRQRVRAILPQESEREELVALASRLDWESIPAESKRKLLLSLTAHGSRRG